MIELLNVTIRAGEFTLKHITLQIQSGEYAVLMGPTGIGKTTILEAICGLRKIELGAIVVDGVDVSDWLPGDRGIGYLPQDLALFPHMKVHEHLSFALKLRKQSRAEIQSRIRALADRLKIYSLLDRTVKDLSGGEKQRVALGRAISFQPKVLLLDEPFSALDEQTRDEMHLLLKDVTHEANMTTLHITHSEDEAAALADRRFRLEAGGVLDQTDSKKIPAS